MESVSLQLGGNAIQQTVTWDGLSEALAWTPVSKRASVKFRCASGGRLAENVTRARIAGNGLSRRAAGWFLCGGLVPTLTWYPSRYGYKDGLRSETYSLAAVFAVNVLREFIFHK